MCDFNLDVNFYLMWVNVIMDVGLGIFWDVDVVIGCLDNCEVCFWVNCSCWKVIIFWVDGGI